MLWADLCCHGNEIWSRRGDPVAYRLVNIIYHLHQRGVVIGGGPPSQISLGLGLGLGLGTFAMVGRNRRDHLSL